MVTENKEKYKPKLLGDCKDYKNKKGVEEVKGFGFLFCDNYDCGNNTGHYRLIKGEISPGPTVSYEGDNPTGRCLLYEMSVGEVDKIINDFYEQRKNNSREESGRAIKKNF